MQEDSPAAGTMDASVEPPRSIMRSPFVWAFLGGIIMLTLIRPLLRHEPAPPSVLSPLPEYSLVATDGKPFGSADLAGQVYVANFIFTRCPSVCPQLTAAMARLQRRYDESNVDGVRLVSISVDPDYDTPARLRAYGEMHGVDEARWALLTGELEQIRRLVIEGFRTPLGDPDPEGNLVDIAHSTRFVLVDPEGGIRGYFDNDADGLDEIFHRSQHVLEAYRRR